MGRCHKKNWPQIIYLKVFAVLKEREREGENDGWKFSFPVNDDTHCEKDGARSKAGKPDFQAPFNSLK